jgi:tetratricopeptide (TPR) repeat protein
VYFFNKAAEMDADDSDYFFNLGYGYWLDKDTQAAIYWLREAVRRNTADADAHMVLGAALQTAGSTAEAARERELARHLSSKYEDLALKPGTGDTALRYLERVSTALDPTPGVRLDAALLKTAHRDQSELASFHLDRGRRLFAQERNLEALGELRKAVYLAPYRSEPHLLIGRTYLRTGRPREAADALRVAIWSEETAAARLSLAEALLQLDDRTAARREAARALELDPNSPSAKDFLARLDKR